MLEVHLRELEKICTGKETFLRGNNHLKREFLLLMAEIQVILSRSTLTSLRKVFWK